ncbi:DUF2027 domain-containing protein [Prolixibacteraceae bacterium JC049]|nr:DUF2027 domain-containing protein [Prolixibacteraceae bacterium JC049]
MIKIGDKVRFLNDVGGGKVTGFIGKSMVNVENEDGFEIPVLLTDVVVVNDVKSYSSESSSSYRRSPEPEPEVEDEDEEDEVEYTGPIVIQGNDEPKFAFAFVPDDARNPLHGELKAYLINDSNLSVLFQYVHYKDGKYKTVESGVLEPNTKLYLESYAQNDLANMPQFYFQMIYFHIDEAPRLHNPLQKHLEINPIRFYKEKSYKETGYFQTPAILFKLKDENETNYLEDITEKEFKEIVSDKLKGEEESAPKEQPKRNENPEILEIDLHLHEVADAQNGLSKKEILDLQMERMRREMDDALKAGEVKRIVFIHGVGNGRLKQEVRHELDRKYKKYVYQDASFKEYGYGATMVILKR